MSIPSERKTENQRKALFIAAAFLLAILANLILSIVQSLQTGAWQNIARGGLVIIFGIITITATRKIKRGEVEHGIWLILGGFLGTLTATPLLLSGFSSILVPIELILGVSVTALTLNAPKRNRAFGMIILAAIITVIIDQLPLNYRIPAPSGLTQALPIIAASIVIALLVIAWLVVRWRSVQAKLLAPTLFFISLVVATIVAYNAVINIQQFDADEKERLEVMQETVLSRITSDENFAVALAIEAAQNTEVQKAFAEQDRKRLTELTLPAYEELDARFSIPQHQFHLPPAVSFLRLHSLEEYGDDLSTFRFTVIEANEERRVVSGLEVGRGGIGIRGVSPVRYEGQHIGTVEFGLNLDQTLLDALKEEYAYDFQIGISKEAAEIVTLIEVERFKDIQSDYLLLQASTLETPFGVEESVYKQALEGTPTITHINIDNREFAVLTSPLIDFSGNIIGTFEIISDHTEITQAQNQQVVVSVAILLVALLFAGTSFTWIAQRTLQPIGALTTAANAIATGDFTQNVDVQTGDELDTLATAFNTMADEIQENVRTLAERVAERTQDQATVAEIATEISAINEMHPMLARMVHLTQRGFNLYHAHVFTFHPENTGEELKIIACGYRKGDEHEGTHGTTTIDYNNEHSIVARCAQERQPIIVNDVRNSPDWLPNPKLPETRAEMAIPLVVGDQLLGVLDVQSEKLNHFTEADANIQATLAAQVAVVMQNLMQFEETQKIARELGVVAEVGLAAATEIDAEHLLQNVVDLSKKSFQLYHAHIYLLNEAGDTLQLSTGAGEIGKKMVAEGRSIPLDAPQSLVARAARTKQGVIVNDVRLDPNFLPHPLLPQTRAELAVPMLVGGKVIGVLDVQSEIIGRFTQTDANIQTTLASQIAIALQNAHSIQRAQKQAARETTLNLITQKIQQADTIEKAMQIAARELGNALGKRKTIVALDPKALNKEEN